MTMRGWWRRWGATSREPPGSAARPTFPETCWRPARRKSETLSVFSGKAEKALERLEGGFEDGIAVLWLPERYRKRLRTTNGMERLNEEIRRRERVIRIFPNRASAERLLGALLLEQDEGWSTGRVYLEMSEYGQWREAREQAAAAST